MAISGTPDREPLQHGGFPAHVRSRDERHAGDERCAADARSERDWPACRRVDAGGGDLLAGDQPAVLQLCRRRAGPAPAGRQFEFGHVMPCKDGYLRHARTAAASPGTALPNFFGRAELKDHRFADQTQRMSSATNWMRSSWTRPRTARWPRCSKRRRSNIACCCGIVQTPEDLATCAPARSPRLLSGGGASGDRPDPGPIPAVEHGHRRPALPPRRPRCSGSTMPRFSRSSAARPTEIATLRDRGII